MPNPELFAGLPVYPAPADYSLNLYELVPILLNDYPGWGETDIIDFVEEKTCQRIHPEEVTTLRAIYQRCHSLDAEFLTE